MNILKSFFRTEEQQYLLNRQLYEASRKGDNEAVLKLLNEGANINYYDAFSGRTVLGVAAQNGHTETIQLLISRQELNFNMRDISQDNTETPAATESTDYAPYLEKAASKGTVITRQSSLGLCGAAGTGKTSTLRLITGQPPINVHDSTPILKPEEHYSNDDIEDRSHEPSKDERENNDFKWNSDDESDPPTQSTAKQQNVASMKQGLLIFNETSTEWKPATQEVLLERLANCTVTAVEQEKMIIEGKTNTCLLIKGFAMTKNENQTEQDPMLDKSLEDDSDGTTPESKSLPTSRACNEISSNILEFLELNKTLKPLGITHFISTCDTGGQAAFLDVAPAFLRYNSINLILLKLDENLDDPAQFFYSVKGVRVGGEKRQISTRALVHSFVSSKSKIRKPSIKGMTVIKQPQKPKFMILGTHFDKYKEKLGKCQSKEEKNQVLRKDLAGFGDCLRPNGKTKLIFSLNTLDRDKANNELAAEIRKMVMENYIEAEIPVSWYIFQLAVYKAKSSNENQGMIRLSTLIAIGTISKMPREEVEACMLYFHDLQVCLYFPTVVANVVFTNPQFLFDKISEIIAVSFTTSTNENVRKIWETDDELQKFTKCGIFTETLIKKVCKGFKDDIFSSNDFLALMSHLFVVCSLPDTDEYFMPCILATHPNPCEDFGKCLVKPLALTWDESVPNGLFPSLTTKIQARNGINGIRFTMSRVEQQYRNKITLDSVDLGCKVTLVECTSFIAASINMCTPLPPDSDSYVKVRRAILRCIDDIVNRLNWVQAEPEECFICDMCPSECPVHLCYPNQSLTVLSCGMTENKATLTSSHLAWRKEKINNPQLLDVDKDRNDVVIALTPVHHMWDKLGVYLNIPDSTIKSIANNYNHDHFRQMSDLISTWIRRPTKEHHPSWGALCQALENMGEAALAEKITSELAGKVNQVRNTNKSYSKVSFVSSSSWYWPVIAFVILVAAIVLGLYFITEG